jgi:hypothetical protein
MHFARATRTKLLENFITAEASFLSQSHYFFLTGTFYFNSSIQLSTTLICPGARSSALSIKKRWPSGETS